MRKYSSILVVLGMTLTLILMTWISTSLIAKEPAGWDRGEKEGWKTETPPGWENWDKAKQQNWQHGLEQAKESVKKDELARLDGALVALEKAARKGVAPEDAQEAVKAGLDQGLGSSDFEPLGKFVVEKHQQGLKGKDLAEVIHQETKRRKTDREEAREKMKEEKGIDNPEKGKGKDKQESDKVDGEEKGEGKDKNKPEKEDEGKGKGKGKGKGN